jgi:hypothetical protein
LEENLSVRNMGVPNGGNLIVKNVSNTNDFDPLFLQYQSWLSTPKIIEET